MTPMSFSEHTAQPLGKVFKDQVFLEAPRQRGDYDVPRSVQLFNKLLHEYSWIITNVMS